MAKSILLTVIMILFHLNESISTGNVTRVPPLYGIGNELIFQQLNLSQLNNLISSTLSSIQRFPGGTPSDYWLWNIGWVNTSLFITTLPELQALPFEWNKYLSITNISNTIIVLNQLNSNLSFQLNGLKAHKQSSTSISFIELGNEMYDDTRSDVMLAYPTPADYAKKMMNWSNAIYNQFPNAKQAIIGWGMSNISDKGYTSKRESIWNEQVLNNTNINYSNGITSTTIHLYYNIYGDTSNSNNTVKLLQEAFINIKYDSIYWNETIPKKYNLWVTEMGTFGNNNLLYTWFEALYMGVLELFIPFKSDRIEMILPYCIVCGDPNMPAFIYNNKSNIYQLTGIGILETMLISQMRDCDIMTILDWDNNGDEQYLIGWKLDFFNDSDDGKNVSKAIIININQYGYETKMNKGNILQPNCNENNDDEMFIKSIYTDNLNILIKTHSTIDDLTVKVESLNASNTFTIPPWSVNVIYCVIT